MEEISVDGNSSQIFTEIQNDKGMTKYYFMLPQRMCDIIKRIMVKCHGQVRPCLDYLSWTYGEH